MPEQPFVIVRDARGSLVHVRRRRDGTCMGCIEVGLYEIVRALVLGQETAARPTEGCGACGETFPTQKRAVAHALTHTA